jgi:truncated hemoglobin YjbI
MAELHAGVEVTPERFDRYVEIFAKSANDTGMNQQTAAHFVNILNSYRNHLLNKPY